MMPLEYLAFLRDEQGKGKWEWEWENKAPLKSHTTNEANMPIVMEAHILKKAYWQFRWNKICIVYALCFQ